MKSGHEVGASAVSALSGVWVEVVRLEGHDTERFPLAVVDEPSMSERLSVALHREQRGAELTIWNAPESALSGYDGNCALRRVNDDVWSHWLPLLFFSPVRGTGPYLHPPPPLGWVPARVRQGEAGRVGMTRRNAGREGTYLQECTFLVG